MIICVVTPYDSNNFGAFLQAYALKMVLELHGHTVHHVRFRADKDVRRLFYNARPSVAQLADLASWRRANAFGRLKLEKFERDLGQFSLIDLEEARAADVVILGSDEIWNVRHRAFRKPIFYGHGFKEVIAYAPSIGSATLQDFGNREDLIEDLRRIQTVLVRDRKSADFVREVTSFRPPIVVDPTLLHGWSEELPLATDPYLDSHRYLLVYAYNSKNLPVEELLTYARDRRLKIVSAGFQLGWCNHVVNCSPLEFLDVVARAECVVTTTFHGSISSILQRKRFVSFPTSPKTADLLVRLGLTGRIDPDQFWRTMEAEIPYRDIAETLENERVSSQAELLQALARVSSLSPVDSERAPR